MRSFFFSLWHSTTLLFPALFPSWRFFDVIAPSPRIEYALLETAQSFHRHWQELRPRPAYLSPLTLLKRLFWNPYWNESLFLVSCAERLMQNPTQHSQQEILTRMRTTLHRQSSETALEQFQFNPSHKSIALARPKGPHKPQRGLSESIKLEHSAHKPNETDKPGNALATMAFVQFRLVFISRQGDVLQRHVTYISPIYPFSESTPL